MSLALRFDEGIPAGLETCAAITAMRRGRFVTRRIAYRCFDTADFALARAGIVLLVERIGRRFIQSVTAPSGERRDAVAGFALDAMALDAGAAAPWREGVLANAAAPICAISLRRRRCRLDAGGVTVDFALDAGRIRVPGRSLPVAEARLTLGAAQGSPGTLFEVAQRIFTDHPFSLAGVNPVARGVAMARAAAPATAGFARVELTPSMTADAAMRRLLWQCQAHILANHEAAMDGRDPEGVHQLRVGLRRLRSGLRLLRPVMPTTPLQDLTDEAGAVAASCGVARAFDVLLDETLPLIESACGARAEFGALRMIATARRAEAYVGVCETLGAARYVAFQLALGIWIGTIAWPDAVPTLERFAPVALAAAHRRVLRRGRHFRALEPDALHRLRIAAKVLRYTAEFFRPLIGHRGTAKPYFKRLSRLQARLGAYNDMVTTEGLLARMGEHDAAGADRAIGLVIGWEARGRIETAKQRHDAWRAFRKADPPWPRHLPPPPTALTAG
ncbi:MAG: CHAD domain-containing protein [Acidiphilium sp.]